MKTQLDTLKEIISRFDTKEAKRYWIKALNVRDSIKGYLTIYFNL